MYNTSTHYQEYIFSLTFKQNNVYYIGGFESTCIILYRYYYNNIITMHYVNIINPSAECI